MIRLGCFFVIMLSLPICLHAFPLDGADETGIARLEGYRLAQQGKVAGNRLFKGAQMPSNQIELRLASQDEFAPLTVDVDFTKQVVELLGDEADNYSISLMDMSDPEQFRYVGHHADRIRNPGSVGKLLVTLAVFQTLADIYPDDFEARHRLLRDSFITADEFIRVDHHRVPFWLPEKNADEKASSGRG